MVNNRGTLKICPREVLTNILKWVTVATRNNSTLECTEVSFSHNNNSISSNSSSNGGPKEPILSNFGQTIGPEVTLISNSNNSR